jgi:hypothetical protein
MAGPARTARHSWRLTIREQRREVADVLADNPSLRGRLDELVASAYGKALLVAQRETDLPEEAFPAECPWTFGQAMEDELRPEIEPSKPRYCIDESVIDERNMLTLTVS